MEVNGVKLEMASNGLVYLIDSIEGLETIHPITFDILSKFKPGNVSKNIIIADNETFGVLID